MLGTGAGGEIRVLLQNETAALPRDQSPDVRRRAAPRPCRPDRRYPRRPGAGHGPGRTGRGKCAHTRPPAPRAAKPVMACRATCCSTSPDLERRASKQNVLVITVRVRNRSERQSGDQQCLERIVPFPSREGDMQAESDVPFLRLDRRFRGSGRDRCARPAGGMLRAISPGPPSSRGRVLADGRGCAMAGGHRGRDERRTG